MAAAGGLLPIVLLRPSMVPPALIAHLHQMLPLLLFAGLALLTSVLAAGTMLVLRELGVLRKLLERAAALPAQLPARISNWHGLAAGGVNATTPCRACGRTNWSDALACVDCGAAIADGDSAHAH